MNDNELKPCPYCGTHIVAHEHDGIYNWVECQNVDCQASGNVVMILGRVEVGEAIAAKKWNTRPIEDALRARIAELEAAVDAAQIDEVTRLAKQAEWARAMLENEQLKAEVERLREAQRWIPVTERLPEDDALCLVYYGEDDCYGSEYAYHSSLGEFSERVTHWMPLPPPPHHP